MGDLQVLINFKLTHKTASSKAVCTCHSNIFSKTIVIDQQRDVHVPS